MVITPIFAHDALIDEVLSLLDEADSGAARQDQQKSKERATDFLKKAIQKGDKKAAEFWKQRLQGQPTAQKRAPMPPVAKPSAPTDEKPGSADTEKPKEGEPENPFAPKGYKKSADKMAPPKQPDEKDIKTVEMPAVKSGAHDDAEKAAAAHDDAEKAAAKDAADKDAEKKDTLVKGVVAKMAEKPSETELPADEKTVDSAAKDVDVAELDKDEGRLVQNQKHRERKGKEAADEISKRRKESDSEEEEPGPGVLSAIGDWAKGALDALSSKTLGKAAGSLVFASLGGLAFGGIGALAGIALAQYFAQKASSSHNESTTYDSVRQAILLAEKKSDDSVAKWKNHVLDSVEAGFNNLGAMDPAEMAAILKAAHRFKKDLLPPKEKR